MKRKQYTIYSDKIDSSKNIAVCSDLHLNENTSKKKITELLETLDEIKPSHIVIPGDLYDVCHSTIEVKNDIVTDFINEVTDIADVYYVKGNIEQRSMLLPYGLYYNNNPHFYLLCENNALGKDKIIYNDDVTISGTKTIIKTTTFGDVEIEDGTLRYFHNLIKNSSYEKEDKSASVTTYKFNKYTYFADLVLGLVENVTLVENAGNYTINLNGTSYTDNTTLGNQVLMTGTSTSVSVNNEEKKYTINCLFENHPRTIELYLNDDNSYKYLVISGTVSNIQSKGQRYSRAYNRSCSCGRLGLARYQLRKCGGIFSGSARREYNVSQ